MKNFAIWSRYLLKFFFSFFEDFLLFKNDWHFNKTNSNNVQTLVLI